MTSVILFRSCLSNFYAKLQPCAKVEDAWVIRFYSHH